VSQSSYGRDGEEKNSSPTHRKHITTNINLWENHKCITPYAGGSSGC